MSSSIKEPKDPALYRPCVGVMLLSQGNQAFVAQRRDQLLEAWQMPQGGIDDGEDAETAFWRELNEETGLTDQHVSIIQESSQWLYYDLPTDLQKQVWGGKYLGQRQRWFLARFTGQDSDVNIFTHTPAEFTEWKWVPPEQMISMIVPFKVDLYKELLKEFSPLYK